VYLAASEETGELVALKVMKKAFIKSSEVVERVMLEKKLLASLSNSSPHIIKFIGAFTTPQSLCIVTEYLSGGDIRTMLRHVKRLRFLLLLLLTIILLSLSSHFIFIYIFN